MKQGTAIFLITILAFALAGEAGAADGAWGVEFSPYAWWVCMDGDVNVNHFAYDDMNTHVSDVREEFEASPAGFLTVRWENLLAMADMSYVDVDHHAQLPWGKVDTEVESTLATLAVGYRFTEGGNAPTVDVFAGGRYNREHVDIDSPTLGSVSHTEEWIDPIVGLTLFIPVTGRIVFSVMADVGGFGVGSDIAGEVMPLVTIGLTRTISLKAGYRVVDVDYCNEDGSFQYDTITQGWLTGIIFRF